MKIVERLLFTLVLLTIGVSSAEAEGRTVVGLVEEVKITPGGLTLEAKLDTGADHSSLHAVNISRFRRGSERWVRFDVVNTEGDRVTLERELARVSRIKSPDDRPQKRPTVMLGVCLGNVYKEIEVNLVDRSRFRNKMLIGRSFMKDKLLVDPSKKFTLKPTCSDTEKQK
ncbi:MAG: RimK/LysX family protein [Thermodesulfobacteriota bacterium]